MIDNDSINEIPNDLLLPQKSLFRIDEVAAYFGVTERCIRLWIQHKHLTKEKIHGCARIPRESILKCRFKRNKSDILED
jgi:hypothetical protein